VGAKEVFSLRKLGRPKDALELARAEIDRHSEDVWFLRAYAWALYDMVKKPVEDFEAGRLSPTSLTHRISPLLREFAQFGDPLRKDTAFSQMLRLAMKASRAWPDFLLFARWAGVDDFDPEGSKPFVTPEGKQIDSLQAQFTRAVARQTAALAETSHADRGQLAWGTDILENALTAAPNDQWLNYYRSRLHLALGEDEEAIRRLVPVLRRQQRAAWPWAQLGRILEERKPQDSTTCYAHAVQIAREEQEVANVRIRLAHLLALVGRFDEAADQVRRALSYREEHGFKAPQDLYQLTASDWFRRAVESQTFCPVPDASKAASALLRDLDRRELVYAKGVVDHINAEKALTYVATGVQTGVALSHRHFPAAAALAPGTVLEVGRAEAEGPAVDWRPAQRSAVTGLFEEIRGRIERKPGQAFAFVKTATRDVFVPPPLAVGLESGSTEDVSCWAIRRANKNGVIGWRAITAPTRPLISPAGGDEESAGLDQAVPEADSAFSSNARCRVTSTAR
jgi:tetratricopeptide (TPR) repeat protein